jgi:hypothetical protein
MQWTKEDAESEAREEEYLNDIKREHGPRQLQPV